MATPENNDDSSDENYGDQDAESSTSSETFKVNETKHTNRKRSQKPDKIEIVEASSSPDSSKNATDKDGFALFLTSARFLLLVVNAVFVLAGVATIWLGGLVDQKFQELRLKEHLEVVDRGEFNQFTRTNEIPVTYEKLESIIDSLAHTGLGIKCAGIFMILIAVTGILGTVFVLPCMLVVYSCILRVIILLEVAIIVVLFVLTGDERAKLVRDNQPFIDLMKSYQWNNTFTDMSSVVLEGVQFKLECCGDKSFEDYDRLRPPQVNALKLPYSCCNKYNRSAIAHIAKNHQLILKLIQRPETLNLTNKVERYAKQVIKEKTGVDLSGVQLLKSDVNMGELLEAVQKKNFSQLRPADFNVTQIAQLMENAKKHMTENDKAKVIETAQNLTGVELSNENFDVDLINIINMVLQNNNLQNMTKLGTFSGQIRSLPFHYPFDDHGHGMNDPLIDNADNLKVDMVSRGQKDRVNNNFEARFSNNTPSFGLNMLGLSRIDLSEYGLPSLNLSGVDLSRIKYFTADNWMPLFGFDICRKTETAVVKIGCGQVVTFVFDLIHKALWWLQLIAYLHLAAVAMAYIIICSPAKKKVTKTQTHARRREPQFVLYE